MSYRALKFWTQFKPGKDGKPQGVDMVEYCAAGQAQKQSCVEAVSRLAKLQPYTPDNPAIMMAHQRWNALKPAYQAWKQGHEVPIDGIALAAWPGVSPEQAEALRMMGLRTVEEVAGASDSIITKIPFPGSRELRASAGAFLKSFDKQQTAAALTELETQNKALVDQLEEMRQIVLEMQRDREGDKPKRGKRVAEEQAAA
jgi:hypothetical protein